MDADVKEKIGYLESVLGQYIVNSDMALSRLERNISNLSSEMQDFIDFVPEIGDWFPQARSKTMIPVFSSLYIPEDSVRFLTKHRIFVLAMKDDNMDLLNPELISI